MLPLNFERAQIERDLCEKSLRDYVEYAWPVIEPTTKFKGNWHIDAICDHLQAVKDREITRLVINMPPGCMKSILCTVLFPTWTWIDDPGTKWITASYSDRFANRDAYRSMKVLQSPQFQKHWGHKWKEDRRQWASSYYRNSRGGFRFAVTVAGGSTGEHADHQLVDDPIKPMDADNSKVDTVELAKVNNWWDTTMSSRVTDAATSTRTIVMQRLHDRDLSGHVLASGGYDHLVLPMRYEPKCVVQIPHRCSLETGGAALPTL